MSDADITASEQDRKREKRRAPQAPNIALLREILDLDPSAPTRLRWRKRPRAHFLADQSWRAWNTRYGGKPVKGCASGRNGDLRVAVTVDRKLFSLAARRVAVALATGTWPKPLRRGPP